ncbi:MAG: DUF58 domain-containing protein [Xenococcus sp. MO_188.B8]|nr:DUF58 domain-containing protein [Xenococcus sp. MO_188.B8]
MFSSFSANPSYSEFRSAIALNKSRYTSISYLYYCWGQLVSRKTKASAKFVNLPTIKAQGKTKVVIEIEPTARGIVELTGITIARPDPFSLFNACKTLSLKQSLLVLPKRYQVPQFQLPGLRKTQSGSMTLASSVGDSEEFVSLRDYRPGDPLRKIHWRSWAKTDKPIVREEQEEFFVRHALILDSFDERPQRGNLAMTERGAEVPSAYPIEVLGTREFNSAEYSEIMGVTTCQDKSFDSLTSTVMNRVSLLSGCICILIHWDEARKKLIRNLQEFNIPTLVLVVTEHQEQINDFELGKIHSLQLGKIQENLIRLSNK